MYDVVSTKSIRRYTSLIHNLKTGIVRLTRPCGLFIKILLRKKYVHMHSKFYSKKSVCFVCIVFVVNQGQRNIVGSVVELFLLQDMYIMFGYAVASRDCHK